MVPYRVRGPREFSRTADHAESSLAVLRFGGGACWPGPRRLGLDPSRADHGKRGIVPCLERTDKVTLNMYCALLYCSHYAMRLDIGADGKIIGARRVSPNGQVSGLTEYAGREVLVILPGGSDGGSAPPGSNVEEITRMVNEQIRQAYDRYRILQETYATPWDATRSFMQGLYGWRTPDLVAEVDRWIRDQVRPPSPGGDPRASSPSRDGAKGKGRRRRPSANRAKGSGAREGA